MQIYMRYRHTGDILKWEFIKFSVFNSFLISYYNVKTHFHLVYPTGSLPNAHVNAYFEDVFEITYDFDFKQEDDTNVKSSKIAYLDKLTTLPDDPTLFIDESMAIRKYFEPDPVYVYFYRKTGETENRFASLYRNIGIFEAIYDDRVMIVPKSIAQPVLDEIDRLQKNFQYNDSFIDGIIQYIIQTHAIVNNIEIRELDQNNFIEASSELCWFLSRKTSAVFLEQL